MEPRPDVLERNLRALARTSPEAARLIEATPARADVRFVDTDERVPSASIGFAPASRALASRRRPLAEAERLAATIDLESAGGVVVLGFGVGHHVGAMARRLRRAGVVIVFEPDVALLRSVLERVDHADWIGATNLVLLTSADDAGAMSGAIRGVEGILALGVKVLEHPPSRPRLGPDADRFVATLTQMVSALRSTLVTTLVQVETTIRNELQNLDHYATCPGIADLAGVASDRPAVVVAAGPSLQRTIHLLEDPGLRSRVVIVAVQTVLRPLLERGIRPHFVTALDYHEISRRFYEDLSPEDVEGVTLVAEAKANPAILEAFPGNVRVARDAFLDDVLGPDLARPMGAIEPGATVAHLAYYLARHLGCDPVILTGQDLGFTDGQYYAAGAAIHRVWSGELNPFNTLEMMEWQRIVRGRKTLRRLADAEGRPIYTDEQMNSYLVQFERDFGADAARGLRTIDATEGGVRKKHTTVMPLAEALGQWAGSEVGDLRLPDAPGVDRDERLSSVDARVAAIRADVARVAGGSRRAKRLLEKMLDHQDDNARVNVLIRQVYEVDAEVKSLSPAFAMVQHINQTGVLNRFRADRSIGLDDALDPAEKQRRQIERDITNVSWLADAADHLGAMLDDARAALAGRGKVTRDPITRQEAEAPATTRASVAAIIPVDCERDALGRPRPLDAPLHAGDNPLRLTLRRLGRSRRVKDVVLLTHEPERVRALAGDMPGLRVHVEPTDAPPLAGRRPAIRGARAWAAECWRGGLATFTCYDELLAPSPMRGVMHERSIDAAVLLGADWALVDPAIVDAVVERHLERPDRHRVVFSQAAPGLGPCLLARSLMDEMADKSAEAGVFASIGALLGYVPIQPQADPIARPVCVGVDPGVRDLGLRCVADGAMRDRVARVLASDPDADARDAADLLARDVAERPDALPSCLTLELTAVRPDADVRRAWHDAADRAPIDLDLARSILEPLAGTHTPITLTGFGDPLGHPRFDEILALALAAGPVHVRTDLGADDEALIRLVRAGVDVVSVDVLADDPATRRALTGTDDLGRLGDTIRRLLDTRRTPDGPDALPTPWIVPRLTRCDEVYEEVEPFFDRWIMTAGAAIIDPLPRPVEGARIAPLPLPLPAAARRDRTRLTILADGSVPLDPDDLAPRDALGADATTPLQDLWAACMRARATRNSCAPAEPATA